MWKRNFLFKAADATPLEQSENELFHDAEPAMDSAGMQLEKFLSVWVQGEGSDDAPTMFTNVYVRTATLDTSRKTGFLQPLQEYQGLGIGRQLACRLVEALLQAGIRSMLLWVFADNPARSFYEALGGQYLRTEQADFGGVMVDEVAYGWPDISVILQDKKQ